MNIKQILKQSTEICGVFLIYLATYAVVRILFVSFLTYISIAPGTKLGDLSDALSNHELTISSLGSLLFILGSIALYPLVLLPRSKFLQRGFIFPYYFRSFTQGAWLALVFCLLFLVLGTYRYLGFFIHYEGAPLALLALIMRMSFLIALIYCDEYFFREQLLGKFVNLSRTPLTNAVVLTSLLYVGLRAFQFDLGWMHAMTLFLIGIKLAQFRIEHQSFVHGAGWLSGLFVIIHVFFGLPIFGVEFPGVLLLKYSEPMNASRIDILLTGGGGGPLSSILLQLYLLGTILWQAYRNKSIIK
ncbi:MAG: hypothetical protein KA715_12560 [Xanthomonadaceae bacterium]|nr:hypothetical protein [Xanthomonadaceae bacterium]